MEISPQIMSAMEGKTPLNDARNLLRRRIENPTYNAEIDSYIASVVTGIEKEDKEYADLNTYFLIKDNLNDVASRIIHSVDTARKNVIIELNNFLGLKQK